MVNKPNYDYLLKLETWSKKEAALIVCGLDPQDYSDLTFSQKTVTETLQEAYRIYRVFRSVNFVRKYGAEGLHPLDYVMECNEKDIPLPDKLKHAVKRRLEHLKNYNGCVNLTTLQSKLLNENKISLDEAGVRERPYLLKIIGAIATVYFSEKDKFSQLHYSRRVISDLVEAISQHIVTHNLNSAGLGKSNLYKKIAEGLALFYDETP